MIEVLAFATTVVCAIGGLVVLGTGVLGRYRRSAVLPLLVMVEVVLLVQAVADVLGQAGGHRPAETATHAAYLGASLVVLPAAGPQARDDGRWSAVLIAAALLALAVIVVRMQTTWRVTDG